MLSYFLPRYLCPTAIKGILKACKAPVVSLNSTGAPIPMTPENDKGKRFCRLLFRAVGYKIKCFLDIHCTILTFLAHTA